MSTQFRAYMASWGRWETARPTEMQALHLIMWGWYPALSGASVDDTGSISTKAKNRVTTPIDWNPDPEPHPDAVGQKCIDCGKRKPLTADFWDKDTTCKHGYKTQCKPCRRRYQNRRNAKLAG